MKILVAIAFGLVFAVSANTERCGQRKNVITGVGDHHYIVGGDEATPNEFPWQISFQVQMERNPKKPNKWFHSCGGSILNEQSLLTAAHCHMMNNTAHYRVIAGAHNLTANESSAQTFKVDQFISHPGWDAIIVKDDIALVKIDGRFKFDDATVEPICLPATEDGHGFDKATCVTSGWGKTAWNESVSDVLLKVNLPVLPNSVCALRYRNVICARITDEKLCAGYLDMGGYGTCQADSGGPFACLQDGAYKLLGVTSFGVGCGSAEHPVVYTRVTSYLDWIANVLASN